MGHASTYSRLLHEETSRVRIFQSALKTCGSAARIVHVASSRMLRRGQVDDEQVDATGCVKSLGAF
jgi:hypothetical protein